MKTMYLAKPGGFADLIPGRLPRPRPQAGEVLVKVHATAVTPTEFGWYPTFHTREGRPRPFPVVPGHEFSGVVAAVGAAAGDWVVGDEVFGLNDWFANGALAEYCVAPATALARKPVRLTHAMAAVVPLSALTAWQALVERGQVQSGQRVLIHGAAGAVGVFAVQLARRAGAQVIATVSADNLEFARALGADTVIDYQAARFEDIARDIDLVFDAVGGETLDRSWSVLRSGGRLVTIASSSASSSDPRAKAAFLLVAANAGQLGEIGRLLDTGELRAFVEATYPLAEAWAAYGRARQGRMRGKIALQVCPSVLARARQGWT